MIAENELFPTMGGECVINSLANLLLIKFGDWQTGIDVIEKSDNHPLVIRENLSLEGRGVHPLVIPKVVSDLTNGKYKGTSFFVDPHICGNDIERTIYADLKYVVSSEIMGRTIDSAISCLDSESISPISALEREDYFPHVLFGSDSSQYYRDVRCGDHAVVRINEDLYVDDGAFVRHDGQFFRQISGILEVEKS